LGSEEKISLSLMSNSKYSSTINATIVTKHRHAYESWANISKS